MRYSVWSQPDRCYLYYEDARTEASANADRPGHLVSRTLGSTIDQAAWPMPAGAKLIGRGDRAIGRVAVPASVSARAALGDFGGSSSLVKAGLLLAAAGLAYKYLLPRRMRGGKR